MQNKQNFCQYYNNEDECPYKKDYKGRIWIAEKQASERANANAYEFLSFVAAHISKWDPYGFAPNIAHYIAEFRFCSFEQKMKLAQAYGLNEELLFEKPKGRTVFEYIDEGGFPCHTRGYLLYFDGRIYSVYEDCPEHIRMYILEGTHKPLLNKVKALIHDNWENIQKLPKETTFGECDDGSYQYYKFLSKRCHGYMMELTEDGKEVLYFAKKIDYIFHYHHVPINVLEPNDFVECWDNFIDLIITDKVKIHSFLDSRSFPEDCEVLGFNMDCFESFNKKYGNDFFNKYGDEKLERVFSLIDDYQILGNAIYSQWRYYNHWAYDPIAEFDANWFKAAFKRLKELWEKQE